MHTGEGSGDVSAEPKFPCRIRLAYAHNPFTDVPTSCSFKPRLTAECLGIYAGLMRLRRNLISSDLLALAMKITEECSVILFGSN